ncbi:MAG: GAF domain-containing protein [Actinobacteria bacterium]|nr:GAF domain-containing protein [Actinomycetota bacterium]
MADAALMATGAGAGWILGVRGEELEVSAAVSAEAGTLVGTSVPAGAGSAGFVVSSGQPLAISPRGDDPRFGDGMALIGGRQPTSVLCVPCATDDRVVGALEVVDKAGGGSFSFDDVELATSLAGIAGVAMTSFEAVAPTVPDPDELAGTLRRLAAADPGGYATTATLVAALLARD